MRVISFKHSFGKHNDGSASICQYPHVDLVECLVAYCPSCYIEAPLAVLVKCNKPACGATDNDRREVSNAWLLLPDWLGHLEGRGLLALQSPT